MKAAAELHDFHYSLFPPFIPDPSTRLPAILKGLNHSAQQAGMKASNFLRQRRHILIHLEEFCPTPVARAQGDRFFSQTARRGKIQ
jgi:hypothetical protein